MHLLHRTSREQSPLTSNEFAPEFLQRWFEKGRGISSTNMMLLKIFLNTHQLLFQTPSNYYPKVKCRRPNKGSPDLVYVVRRTILKRDQNSLITEMNANSGQRHGRDKSFTKQRVIYSQWASAECWCRAIIFLVLRHRAPGP